MSLKKKLLKLGKDHPELRDHLRPILDYYIKNSSLKMAYETAFNFEDQWDLNDDLWREAVQKFHRKLGVWMSQYHAEEYIAFDVMTEHPGKDGKPLGSFVFAEDRNAYLYSKDDDQHVKTIRDTGDIKQTVLKALDEFEKIVKDNLVEIREEESLLELERKKNRELESLKSSLHRWLKRKTDERYVDDLDVYRGGIQGTYRTWSIPKYPEDQDPFEVPKILERDKKDLEKTLAPYKHLIKNIWVGLGDKNWVEVGIDLK